MDVVSLSIHLTIYTKTELKFELNFADVITKFLENQFDVGKVRFLKWHENQALIYVSCCSYHQDIRNVEQTHVDVNTTNHLTILTRKNFVLLNSVQEFIDIEAWLLLTFFS